MRRHTGQTGAALVMLLGITATLLIMTIALVMLLGNQQGATANERQAKTSLYYAEAGLDSAVDAIKVMPTSVTSPVFGWPARPSFSPTTLNDRYVAAYPTGPSVTYAYYDNLSPVNTGTTWDSNQDGYLWVQTTVTYQGKMSRQRVLMSSNTTSSILPRSATYADTDIDCNGTSDIYAVRSDGSAYPTSLSGNYPTTIQAGGDFNANSVTDLKAPGSSIQTLGVNVNGRVTGAPYAYMPSYPGGVGLLSDYFDQYHQMMLTDQAQQAMDLKSASTTTPFNSTATNYTTSASLLAAMTRTGTSPNYTYTATSDMRYTGNLTLNTASNTYNFRSLYVTGNLLLKSTTTMNATAVYVSGNFIISGPTSTNRLGAIYVAGVASWDGTTGSRLGVQTTTLADQVTTQPMYAKILSVDATTTFDSSGNQTGGSNNAYDGSSGPYDLVLGNMWVDGDAGTGDIAINFAGPSSGIASTVMCPLLATTERTETYGYVNFGSINLADPNQTKPMIYYMQCDNDQYYNNEIEWNTTGQFVGIMVIMEASIVINGGQSGTTPAVIGSVMCGTPNDTDITLNNNATVCYNQQVIDHVSSDKLFTTTTNSVPGTWQQLSAH